MKGRIFVCFLLLAIAPKGLSQNLIVNGSFENHTTCPEGYLMFVPPWQPGSIATPVVLDGCVSNLYYGVPQNGDSSFGFQYPRTGDAYIGMNVYYSDTLYRSYLLYPLDSNLVQGVTYCLTFYVNLINYSHFGIDAIGAYFSDTALFCPSPICLLAAVPQVSNPAGNILTDTLAWTEISGCFTASGEERYLIIGNFLPDSLVQKDTNRYNGYNWSTYYYIDDVSLYADTASGWAELKVEQEFSVYPNPASKNVYVTCKADEKEFTFELLNAWGKPLLHSEGRGFETMLDVSHLRQGLYFYRIKTPKGIIFTGKLLISNE